MKDNPYKYEIILCSIGAPAVMIGELWRRWGDFRNPFLWDDWVIGTLGLATAYLLYKKVRMGQLLWVLICGAGLCGIYGSLFGALRNLDQTDPSGFPMWVAVCVKGFGALLIILATYRGLKLASVDFNADANSSNELNKSNHSDAL